MSYPSLADLLALAKDKKLDEVALGLAVRLDDAEAARFIQAERAFEWLGKKGRTLGEAKIAGETAAHMPETPEWFANLLLEIARGN